MNQSLSTARAERIAAEQRWREAQSTPLMSLPEVLSNGDPAADPKRAEAQANYQRHGSGAGRHPECGKCGQITEINKQ